MSIKTVSYSIVFAMLIPVSSLCAHGFCSDSKYISFDNLVRNKTAYANIRIETQATFRTDGRENSSVFVKKENKIISLPLTWDEKFKIYQNNHVTFGNPDLDIMADYLKLMQYKTQDPDNSDYTGLRHYRQVRKLCGRVVDNAGRYYFVADDAIPIRSYLVD